jgi:hypothetical protein
MHNDVEESIIHHSTESLTAGSRWYDEDESLFEEYLEKVASILKLHPSSVEGFACDMFYNEPRPTPREAAAEYRFQNVEKRKR